LKGNSFGTSRTANRSNKLLSLPAGGRERPNYALAYSGLAETYVLFSSYDVAPANDSMLIESGGYAGISDDDSLAEAHTASDLSSNYEWDRDSSKRYISFPLDRNIESKSIEHPAGT